MFVQFIWGKVKDREAVTSLVKEWDTTIRPAAGDGFLGSTWGITEDDMMFVAVRFADEDAKNKLSDSPEQDAWYRRLVETGLEGEPKFAETGEVEIMGDGGSNDAGFVQVISGQFNDKDKWLEVNRKFTALDQPPHILGGYDGLLENNRFVSVIYFTNEADARKAEAEGMPDDMEPLMDEWRSTMSGEPHFTDLKQPRFQN